MAQAHHSLSRDDPEVQNRRKAAGRWLRELREQQGLSQRELAGLVGVEYYAFISQLEGGHGRIPPERYKPFANALGVQPRDFVISMLKYYDPDTYRILFSS